MCDVKRPYKIGDPGTFGKRNYRWSVLYRTNDLSDSLIQATRCAIIRINWKSDENIWYLNLTVESPIWNSQASREILLAMNFAEVPLSTYAPRPTHYRHPVSLSTSTHRSRGSRIRQWFLLPSHLPIYYKVTHVCHPCVSFLTNKPSGF